MTNAEKYLEEMLHDVFCADNEGGSALRDCLPLELQGFCGEYDVDYEDKDFRKILSWLKEPADKEEAEGQ